MGVTLAAVLGRSSLRETLAMLTDWELWACAQHYIREHAEDAPIIAAMRADELLKEGDDEGARAPIEVSCAGSISYSTRHAGP